MASIRQQKRDESARAEGYRSYGHKRYVHDNPTSGSAIRTVRANPALAPDTMPFALKLDLKAQFEGWASHGQKSVFYRDVMQHASDEAKDDKGKLTDEAKGILKLAIQTVNHAHYVKDKPVLSVKQVEELKALFGKDAAYPIMKMMYG